MKYISPLTKNGNEKKKVFNSPPRLVKVTLMITIGGFHRLYSEKLLKVGGGGG